MWSIFCRQLWSFIGFSLPWKFEPNQSWLVFFPDFWVPPFFAKKFGFGLDRVKNVHQPWSFIGVSLPWKFEPNLSWCSFLLTFCVLAPFFAQKSSFGFVGVNFFVTILDHLLGLNYPENLSSIGLMVEAVDTFCGMGMDTGTGTGTGTGTAGDYMDNLSTSFCLDWLGLALA